MRKRRAKLQTVKKLDLAGGSELVLYHAIRSNVFVMQTGRASFAIISLIAIRIRALTAESAPIRDNTSNANVSVGFMGLSAKNRLALGPTPVETESAFRGNKE